MSEYKVGDKVLVAMEIAKVDSGATDDLPYLIKTKNEYEIWISENEIRDKFIEAEPELKWSHPMSHDELIALEHLNAQLQVLYAGLDLAQHQYISGAKKNLEYELICNKLRHVRSEFSQLDTLLHWSDKEFSYKIEDKS